MAKAAAYLRVSTLEQAREGLSLGAQEETIRAYCSMASLNLATVIREEGVSGSKRLADRPGGARLLRLIVERRVNHVVALKLDRLFRDAADALVQTRAWDRDGMTLHLVDMGGTTLNTSSAMGRMFLTLTAALAELERNLVSERTATALAHKKRLGEHIGAPPFGFKVNDHGLERVPEELATVETVQRLRADGATLRQIAAWLQTEGVPTRRGGRWSPEHVRRMLANPVYRDGAQAIEQLRTRSVGSA